LIDEIKNYGKQMESLIEERLKPYFPRQRGESIWNDPLKLHKSEQSDQSVLRGVRG
jgi:hypothetical protein